MYLNKVEKIFRPRHDVKIFLNCGDDGYNDLVTDRLLGVMLPQLQSLGYVFDELRMVCQEMHCVLNALCADGNADVVEPAEEGLPEGSVLHGEPRSALAEHARQQGDAAHSINLFSGLKLELQLRKHSEQNARTDVVQFVDELVDLALDLQRVVGLPEDKYLVEELLDVRLQVVARLVHQLLGKIVGILALGLDWLNNV